MALGYYFVRKERMYAEKYDGAMSSSRRRSGQAEGSDSPLRVSRTARIQVFNIWESQEDFDAFGRR